MIQEGKDYIKNNDFDRAIKVFRQILLTDPTNKHAWLNLGVAYYHKKEYNKVIHAFTRALEFDPENITCWNNLGVAYNYLGDYDKSIDAFKHMLDINPEHDSAWRNLCLTYNKRGLSFDFKGLKPNSDISWYFLAKELLENQYYNDGLHACDRCLAINPSFRDIFKIRKSIRAEIIKKNKMESKETQKVLIKVEKDPYLEKFKQLQKKSKKHEIEVEKSMVFPDIDKNDPYYERFKEIQKKLKKHKMQIETDLKILKKVGNEPIKENLQDLHKKAKPIFISDINHDILDSYFVMDGANIAFGDKSSNDKAKLSNIINLKKKLESFGINRYKIICDKSLYYKIDKKEKYNQYIQNEEITETPAGTEADYYILQYALSKNAFIISNDRFKEFYNAFGENWIKEKRITFAFIDQEVFLDKLMTKTKK